MHIWLGSGTTESLLVEEFLPYWRRLRRQLDALLDADATKVVTKPSAAVRELRVLRVPRTLRGAVAC